ncbi:MAG: aminoglycoside phosphotransferase family protein [Clostridia bacterium]|nr:aminoglycoside phosphotransferase family protein [Clostridia bacterium]
MSNVKDILKRFNIDNAARAYGDGHINDTYLIEASSGKYILQKINTAVFNNPYELMRNIERVASFMAEEIKKEGGDPRRETLMLVKTADGENLARTEDGGFYRMYYFVEDTVTYQAAERPEQFYNAAKAFGVFQKRLAEFPADMLSEIIPDFHNTVKRFADFSEAVDKDIMGRAGGVLPEIEFALSRENIKNIITGAIDRGEIPLRVTHNDTKLNNVLFDKKTDEAICVVDLDTVMPGSLLYDFGDGIRYGASSAAEDEKDLTKVFCRLDYFEAFAKGFLEELGGVITEKEISLMPVSGQIIAYELGMRFLGDYLNGDVYFKTHYPAQNLDRARTQFKLVSDMESKMSEMKDIVNRLTKQN